jgi:sugar lactone lactonase YvrE
MAPDGRLVVGEVLAGSVAAIDLESGAIERLVPVGATNLPDDLAFGDDGTMYITDVKPGRIWARSPDGDLRCLLEDVPSANGITTHEGRIFIDECRPEGRLMEIFPDGSEPRIMAEGLPLPNACAVGPDGLLYVPMVFSGEVWRFPLEGGPGSRFLSGLAHPVAVKFDAAGRLTVVEGRTGAVVQTEVTSPNPKVVGRAARGSDNLEFRGDHILVSSYISGSIIDVGIGGRENETLVDPGFVRPLGIAVGPDGRVHVADGGSIAAVSHDGEIVRLATNADRHVGAPGYSRGICCGPDGRIYVTTMWPTGTPGASNIYVFSPGDGTWETREGATTEGPAGIAYRADGALVIADADGGRVLELDPRGRSRTLACDVERPLGVALDGEVTYVTDVARGRVVEAGGRGRVLVDGLERPEGVAYHEGHVYVLDAGAGKLLSVSVDDGGIETIAQELPTGTPPGSLSPTLGNTGLSVLSPFTGVAVDAEGTLYLGADGEGSVLKLQRTHDGAR